MNRRLFSLALVVGLGGCPLMSAAQQASSIPTEPMLPRDTQVYARKSHCFEGAIRRSGEKLVFEDSSAHQAYPLDDQDAAARFNGRNVKLIATFDLQKKILHVIDIVAEPRGSN